MWQPRSSEHPEASRLVVVRAEGMHGWGGSPGGRDDTINKAISALEGRLALQCSVWLVVLAALQGFPPYTTDTRALTSAAAPSQKAHGLTEPLTACL